MKQRWIEAGYFVLADGKPSQSAAGILPARIVTVSNCIADIYPGYWALPWIEAPSDEQRQAHELPFDAATFADIRSWVARALEQGDLGWESVFFSLRAAREFQERFLRTLPESRIVGLSATEDVAAEFLLEEAPQEGRQGSGVWTMLERRRPLAGKTALLGYDVLGAEFGGDFHNFACNSLERDYREKLGVVFNAHGLIAEYPMARAACEYTNRDDVGAEPVGWYPFRIDDCRAGTGEPTLWSRLASGWKNGKLDGS